MTSTHCPQPPKLEWWAFLIMAFGVFAIFLLINFFVKKINDTRIEERYKRMSDRSTNRATQIKESLELRYQEQEINPANISLVFNKEDNLKKKNKEDLVKSGPSFLDDNYISDWMIVYGRKKSNSYLAQEGTRNNGKRNTKNNPFEESERDDLKRWVENLMLDIINAASTPKNSTTI